MVPVSAQASGTLVVPASEVENSEPAGLTFRG
jgi:hypothetical protein